jgi:hypothetical protein
MIKYIKYDKVFIKGRYRIRYKSSKSHTLYIKYNGVMIKYSEFKSKYGKKKQLGGNINTISILNTKIDTPDGKITISKNINDNIDNLIKNLEPTLFDKNIYNSAIIARRNSKDRIVQQQLGSIYQFDILDKNGNNVFDIQQTDDKSNVPLYYNRISYKKFIYGVKIPFSNHNKIIPNIEEYFQTVIKDLHQQYDNIIKLMKNIPCEKIFHFVSSNNIIHKNESNLLENYLFVYNDYIVLIKYIIEYSNASYSKEVKIEFHIIDKNFSSQWIPSSIDDTVNKGLWYQIFDKYLVKMKDKAVASKNSIFYKIEPNIVTNIFNKAQPVYDAITLKSKLKKRFDIS